MATYPTLSGTMSTEQLQSLTDAFGRLRREVGAHPAGNVPAAVVDVAVSTVAGADWASITQRRGRHLTTTAASDDRARRGDAMQYELGSGPCIDAAIAVPALLIDDLTAESRWPAFTHPAVAELGIASMLSLRLMLDEEDVIGGLNLYSTRPHAFDDQAVNAGHLLAAQSTLAITASLARDEAAQLHKALASNRDIGVAIGILMRDAKATRDQAFDLLRIASQHRHRKLRDVAVDVVETGTLTFPDEEPSR